MAVNTKPTNGEGGEGRSEKKECECEKKTKKGTNQKWQMYSLNFWVPFAIVVVLVGYPWIFYWNHSADAALGSFGDSFGPLTSLYSGLAFAAVVVSLWFQRLDLKQTQEEMRASVLAQEAMAEAMNDQLEAMQIAQEQNEKTYQQQIEELRISRELDLFYRFRDLGDSNTQKFIKSVIDRETISLLQLPRYRNLVKPNVSAVVSSSHILPDKRLRYQIVIASPQYDVKILRIRIDKETIPVEEDQKLGPRKANSSSSEIFTIDRTFGENPSKLSVLYWFELTEMQYKQVFRFDEHRNLEPQEPQILVV